MNILLLEPYFTGSHAAWAAGLKKYSRHRVTILSLKGAYWKWRMHGGAVTLAHAFMKSDETPDLILAGDMLDLTTFLALTRSRTHPIPVALYFHENQLSYPWSPDDRDIAAKRDRHYGFINYVSALAADRCYFNSAFHMDSFLTELRPFLKHFPDSNELHTIAQINEKSRVLPLGLDLRRFDRAEPFPGDEHGPLILWNHRWEYDKNPGAFFRLMFRLEKAGRPFRLALLGENFSRRPEIFEEARGRLGGRIVQYGYAESFSEYARWLQTADLLPVTSRHDFFGISVAEAAYCGVRPILPRRLSYPEIFPVSSFGSLYYSDEEALFQQTVLLLRQGADRGETDRLRDRVSQYDWQRMIVRYDDELADLAGKDITARGSGT